jgi:cysteine desulfurase
LSPATSLVCINHACNEIGTLHDIEKIGVLCQANNIKLLVDGTQVIGHIPIDMNSIPYNYYTFSAHKFGGVRSTGGVLMRDDDFLPLIRGGRQEWNKRAGTENIAGLGAAVFALTKSLDQLPMEIPRLTELTSNFVTHIQELVPTVIVNTPENSIPGFLSLSFPGYKGNEIVTALSLSGFSVSTGSACHANQIEPSRIILALGRSREQAIGTIRISMGYGTTTDAVDALLEAIVEYVQR